MGKIKKFYKNNRIYSILMLISLLCFILIGSGVAIYFINQARSDAYGRRLTDIEKYDAKKDIEAVKDFYEKEKATNVDVRIQGKIIYIKATVDKKLKNEDIENLATKSLEKISSENLSYYDVQFIIRREGMVPYLGSKSTANQLIKWQNYYVEVEETTTTTTKKKKK